MGGRSGEDVGRGGKQQRNSFGVGAEGDGRSEPSVRSTRARRSFLQPGFILSAIYRLWGLRRCQKNGRVILKLCFSK